MDQVEKVIHEQSPETFYPKPMEEENFVGDMQQEPDPFEIVHEPEMDEESLD